MSVNTVSLGSHLIRDHCTLATIGSTRHGPLMSIKHALLDPCRVVRRAGVL